jgi:hypothetical protein
MEKAVLSTDAMHDFRAHPSQVSELPSSLQLVDTSSEARSIASAFISAGNEMDGTELRSLGPPNVQTQPEQPSFTRRMTRKRTADLANLEEVSKESPESQELGPEEDNTLRSSISTAAHICLCQPDPKIPRPRNGQ